MNGKRQDFSLTVDMVIFTVVDDTLNVLLVKRKYEPFAGIWALPGGFVEEDETPREAAERELLEEAGLSASYLEQLYTFGEPRRDPRGRVVSVAHFALVPASQLKIRAGDDAADARLFPVHNLPKLAFDHKDIIAYAVTRVGNKIQYTNVVWSLLPPAFTLSDIQAIYESIWGKKVDKRNFRKKLLSLGLLKPLSRERTGLRQRPAKLYAFKTKQFVELRRFF
ncbi:MAG: hypothetical protein A3I44_03270 [Candidatus Sungbacteria bacterium RIFCSPLOWO2_02_FULL_51_17]|uniref:Nudix hydrolase domain-containing protein n=1 Tax=Candidatus Sungbacteria bacterium RIFCSPHIGHO2_02_FULL_51_29 TaxID=1802273 RepID=A0A1G2KWI8_9BACT|nr:MAG: hypothetical protein A3C16_03315 [Candidatus Sungbacteria bacterium RIFCSPHIGHO2_02_FULL_51_29]OHA06591.1 MAG: hypothetical protein A3B29_02225 [Candidatus Sungbacteria bacterium RIFCSPLOWO2_01_FULL_51_34]OHA10532.1 MAG: hypothetical protein A3I44_03270 [Candidatus Sungbacteria bacterium RIFCSPLOWO2_02_FULL_51_17]